MRKHRYSTVVTIVVLLALAACGGSDKSGSSDTDSNAGDNSDDTVNNDTVNDAPLPAECALAPYTVFVVRDGESPAGSETFEVVGAAAVQIPLVPDAEQVLTAEQSFQQGETTDLLGYGLLFGDEVFGVDDVSLFGGYTPEQAGKSRGVVSIYPSTTTPLAVGDVVTPGRMEDLGMFTTLNNLGMDFKAAPDEFMSYLNSIEGSVTVLGLNDEAICLDVDLRWQVSDFSSEATGTLTIQGIFTAPLAERTLPLG